jgi:uncharacterized protein involved in exopolysaccharide biosynthesis
MQERAPLTARTSIKIAAITFAVLTAISLFVLFSLPKTYVAQTRIEVTTKATPPSEPQQQGHDPYFIQSEFEKIKSLVVLTRAYRELRANPQFKNVARTRAPQDDTDAARALLAGLDVRQSRNTSLFEIRYADRDPQNAALVANTIARAYATEAKARNSGEVRILDLAQPPTRPVSPNVPLLLAIATILNSVLAIMAGFFASNLFR